MKHIRYIVCHPSKIALFYKDSALKVLLFFLLFVSILIGTMAAKTFTNQFFSNDDIDYIISLVDKNKDDINVSYKDYKLTGDSVAIKDTNYECYILTGDETKITNPGLIMFLREDSANVYYGYRLIGNIEYKNIGSNYQYLITNVRANNNIDRYNFRCFFHDLLSVSNTGYALTVFLSNIISLFQYYLIFSIIVLFVYSYFINPTISVNVRLKLLIYDSLVYFIVMFFTFAFQISFLQYDALFMPLIYCNVTFSHIIRVRR